VHRGMKERIQLHNMVDVYNDIVNDLETLAETGRRVYGVLPGAGN
jgi:hypothetical protein